MFDAEDIPPVKELRERQRHQGLPQFYRNFGGLMTDLPQLLQTKPTEDGTPASAIG